MINQFNYSNRSRAENLDVLIEEFLRETNEMYPGLEVERVTVLNNQSYAGGKYEGTALVIFKQQNIDRDIETRILKALENIADAIRHN